MILVLSGIKLFLYGEEWHVTGEQWQGSPSGLKQLCIGRSLRNIPLNNVFSFSWELPLEKNYFDPVEKIKTSGFKNTLTIWFISQQTNQQPLIGLDLQGSSNKQLGKTINDCLVGMISWGNPIIAQKNKTY